MFSVGDFRSTVTSGVITCLSHVRTVINRTFICIPMAIYTFFFFSWIHDDVYDHHARAPVYLDASSLPVNDTSSFRFFSSCVYHILSKRPFPLHLYGCTSCYAITILQSAIFDRRASSQKTYFLRSRVHSNLPMYAFVVYLRWLHSLRKPQSRFQQSLHNFFFVEFFSGTGQVIWYTSIYVYIYSTRSFCFFRTRE